VSPILEIRNISKKFLIDHERPAYLSLRDKLASSFKPKVRPEEFWALRNVSFDVMPGDSIGIIGRNGAGKSTLLKILSRITPPTEGHFITRGRIASLLEVGTGFHQELTGRENVFMNGSILGMKRVEIQRKFDEIIDFSGVEQFLDTPLKHYSSGMQLRLAFAVAAHLEPEILIIDEVLAVGDAEFQRKCMGKMEDVSKSGRTVLFVSHNLNAVSSFCSKTFLLKNGVLDFWGETSDVVNRYLAGLTHGRDGHENFDRRGNGSVIVESIQLTDGTYNWVEDAFTGHDTYFSVRYSSKAPIKNLVARLQVVSYDGYVLFTCNNYHSSQPFSMPPQTGNLICKVPRLPLMEGRYRVNIQLLNDFQVADEIESYFEFHVSSADFFGTGRLPKVKQGVLVNHSWQLITT
jgi:lipopolysaccharide transport system ATP-binding protein